MAFQSWSASCLPKFTVFENRSFTLSLPNKSYLVCNLMSRLISQCCIGTWITSLTRPTITPVFNKLASRVNYATSSRKSGPEKKYRTRRAVLYVPGSDEKKIRKIPSLNVDCAVLDCEDGVAATKKVDARNVIRGLLDDLTFQFGRTERSVRVNSIDTGFAEEDIKEILQAKRRPESIVIPKVQSVDHVDWVADRLTRFGQPDSHGDVEIRVILMIESAKALLNLERICQRAEEKFRQSPYCTLDGLIFGSDDFCASIGATRTKDAQEVLYARQHFVLVAKAFLLQAVDMVYIDYKDEAGLAEQSVKGAQMGFTGKQVIHPGQIPIVQQAFMPSPEKVAWATELIKAFDEHQKSGKGAFTFQGSMIDMPSVLQAKNVVQLSNDILGDKCS